MHDFPPAAPAHTFGDPSARTTRAGWEAFADQLVAATERFASPSGSLIDLPGPVSASGRWSTAHEGFTRTFLAAAFRVRGADGHDPSRFMERYASGLTAGVDPSHAERWPTIAERRQSVPEAASLAIALSETKPWIWDVLDDRVRAQTVDYLAGVVGTSGYTNNWTWFQTVVEGFLAEVGGPWSQADLDRNDEIQERCYIADGWYSDGGGPTGSMQNFDYYAGWAWHVYPLLHARIRGEALAAHHRERLGRFIEQAADLVGTTGAPLFQGRSLTYRFAMLAPFWAAVMADTGALATGETRDLAGRVLGYFRDAGAVDAQGILSIGWHGEFLPLRQLYTGAGSTYWASKAFLGLLLPADHPEWTREPPTKPQPAMTQRSMAAPGWIVVRTAADGIVRVINHGTDGDRHSSGPVRTDKPFYQRLGYSNVTSPDLSPEGIVAPRDSHVSLLDAEGTPSHRGPIERLHLSDRVGVSRSRVHWVDLPGSAHATDSEAWASMRRGPLVTVASVVHGVHELRLAWHCPAPMVTHPTASEDIESAWPEDQGPWRFRLDGWPLPVEAGFAAGETAGVVVGADGIRSLVIGARGITVTGTRVTEAANAFSSASATPWAVSVTSLPGQAVAALVTLGAGEIDPGAVAGIDVSRDEIVVRWADGTIDELTAPGVMPS